MLKIMFIGNLTADPVKYSTTSGKECAQFTVAVNEKHGGNEDTTYLRCTAWEKKGTPILQYCKKGSKIYIEGGPKASAYKDKKTGDPRASLDVNVYNYEFLSSKHSDADEEGYNANVNDGMTVVPDEDVPF